MKKSKDHIHTKHIILVLYIFLLWGIVFWWSQITKRGKLQDFYNTQSQNQLTETGMYAGLPSRIQNELDKIIAYNAIQNKDYDKAIQSIHSQDSESYYTLGAIKTLQAYNEALSSSLSWLQKARYLIDEAFKDFDTADKIKLNNTLDTYIQQNKSLSEQLSVVINIKTCYGEYSYTISALQNFSNTLEQIKERLKEEEKVLNKNSKIDEKCKDNLQNINNTSQQQVVNLQKQINGFNKQYKTNLTQSIKQPIECLEQNVTDISPLILDAGKGVEEFDNNHENTIETLKSGDKDALKELCNFAKDDSQINEKIENSLSKLMKQLQNNLEKKEDWNESEEDISKPSWETQYKSIFEEEELELLREIENNNESLIQQIQNIKWEWKYRAETLLDQLFNSFYGHTGDFQNLLKKEVNWNQR